MQGVNVTVQNEIFTLASNTASQIQSRKALINFVPFELPTDIDLLSLQRLNVDWEDHAEGWLAEELTSRQAG